MRDLLLGRPVLDVDLAIEGAAAPFAEELASRLGASCVAHARFSTATLALSGGSRVDVAATRSEHYPRPGALPEVERGASIREDLARRDFTIHALALELPTPDRLIDPFGGRGDLEGRRIRFLHPASPSDDPTRALRAVRYAGRLGFRIHPSARRQVTAAVAAGAFRGVSGDRLRRELALIFEEEPRARAPRLLASLGLDRALAPALARATPGAGRRIDRAGRFGPGPRPGWLCYLLAWMAPSTPRDLRQAADRLSISGRQRAVLVGWAGTRRRFRPGAASLAPSRRRRLVMGLGIDEVFAAAAVLPGPDARAIRQAFVSREGLKLSISGSDLVSRGVPPGPAIGRALDAARAAREDGKITAGEELAFALSAARRRS